MNPYEYLERKGIKKVHQSWKRYNFSIEELITFLNEYSVWKKLSILKARNDLSTENKDQLDLNFPEDNSTRYIQYRD
jgi:hypothetical protein